jgi:hypothetical protein
MEPPAEHRPVAFYWARLGTILSKLRQAAIGVEIIGLFDYAGNRLSRWGLRRSLIFSREGRRLR